MSLFEVGVVVALVLIVLALLLPVLSVTQRRASRLNCVSNLKQLGLAYRIWEGDNGDIFPMGISTTSGGSMELVQTGNVVATFMVMSNELSTPRILVCPGDGRSTGDTSRTFAADFGNLVNSNVSYFVGVDVTNDANPDLIVSGDGNFQIGGVPVKPGLRAFWTNDPVIWTTNWHGRTIGNLGMADGSVQSGTIVKWKYILNFQRTGLATNRFAIP